ncbi:MAG TPA: sodium:solute symporter [Bacteroidales bacterium]|nr:sodium:solute symporter [Bacteroidales bacterium]
MTPQTLGLIFLLYTSLIFIIAGITGKKADNRAFFIGNKASPWLVVAYGMIGSSLSGVTFISVPGWVRDTQFSYLMVVLGYILGYATIAWVLLPLYYRMNLTSIYTYLGDRFGRWSHRMGSFFFLFSRFIGASLRMYLVINILQVFVFSAWGIPFWVTVLIFIGIILAYTFQGGIKTIVWTDILQTTFMIGAVVLTVIIIAGQMGQPLPALAELVREHDYSRVIDTDWQARTHWLKQFLSGAFIAIVMTGLDQDMMQKNLSCRSLPDAQKNVMTLSVSLVFVNLLFLSLGALLYVYAEHIALQAPAMSDELFPLLAFKYLPPVAGVIFIIGIISAAYSSADGAMTALTTSISVDLLGMGRNTTLRPEQQQRTRRFIHLGVAFMVFTIIMVFGELNNKAIIQEIFTIAGYTYGPLLGMFAFGILTRLPVRDRLVPVMVLVSPLICYVLSQNSQTWFIGYRFGFELLILNGLITFLLLLTISRKK